jgi:hypothetical protein
VESLLHRTVNANPDQEIVFAEEPHPLVRDESAVGLERIADIGVGRCVLCLQCHALLEEFDPREQRFAALLRKTYGARSRDM